jgi:hypothetical protein
MAHLFNDHRAHRVDHARAERLTKGYASGGGVHADASEDRAMICKDVKPSALKHEHRADGKKSHHRADKPHRAHGGRVKGKPKATVVNINVAPQGLHAGLGAAPLPPAAAAPPPPRPPMAPPGAPVAGAPGMPPGMPPGVPPGRAPIVVPPLGVRAKGGAVEADSAASKRLHRTGSLKPRPIKNRRADPTSGPAFSPDENLSAVHPRAGPIEHPRTGRMTPSGAKGIGEGAPVTRRGAKFTEVEAPGLGQAMGPRFTSGAAGAVTRREQSRRARKYYAKAFEGPSA